MFLESLAASSIWLASTGATPGWCRASGLPDIRIGLAATMPVGDFSKSMKELEHFDIDTISPYGRGTKTHVGGLTSGTIKVEQLLKVGGVRYGDQSCIWTTDVTVTLRLDQRVYVARDYPKGSCMHRAVWAHEHKHVRVDREIMNEYRPVYEQAVRSFIAKYPVVGPLTQGQEKQVQEQMIAALRKSISAVTTRMEAERGRRQQAIDTRAEYDRVSAQCRGKK